MVELAGRLFQGAIPEASEPQHAALLHGWSSSSRAINSQSGRSPSAVRAGSAAILCSRRIAWQYLLVGVGTPEVRSGSLQGSLHIWLR